jgi:hypothetical protein
MKRVATIILNRNLPEPTDRLCQHIQRYDKNATDIFVLEAGSDSDRLSSNYTWYANDEDITKNGLRYCRGMNYALLKLFQEGNWSRYDSFFLLTNDTEFKAGPTVEPLQSILDAHEHLGILSPCSSRWGERMLLSREKTKYFWFIHNNALMLRRAFIESIMEVRDPNYMNFLFDGSNFRGYFAESELIGKAYANDWAAAITAEVFAEENESYLLEKSDLIKTDSYEQNLQLYLEEGRQWIRRKYGFNSRWSMQSYVKFFYDSFFNMHPEYKHLKI